MSTQDTDDEELDKFFDDLLAKIPDFYKPGVKEPSPTLQNLVWEAVKKNQDYLFNNGYYFENITALAAATEGSKQAAFVFNSFSGDWSLARENTDDESIQVLKFKCREDLIGKYEGKLVVVQIDSEAIELGVVDHQGIAWSTINSGLEAQKFEKVLIKNANS